MSVERLEPRTLLDGEFQVVATTPDLGRIIEVPSSVLEITFSADLDAATVQPSDLEFRDTRGWGLIPGAVIQVAVSGPTATFTLDGSLLGEGGVRATLPEGAVADTAGNAVLGFSSTYDVDLQTGAIALAPHYPADSLISQGTAGGVFNLPERMFVWAGAGGLGDSTGLAFSPDGRYLFVSSDYGDSVMRYDAATGEPRGLSGRFNDAVFVTAGSGGLDRPELLRFSPHDGNLYVASSLSNQVLRYNGQTGEFMGVFAAIEYPVGLTFGRDANGDGKADLYVSGMVRDSYGYPNDIVAVFDGGTGAFLREFVPGNSGGLDNPQALAFGPDGNLYVSSNNSHQVLRYDGSTGDFMDVFIPAGSGNLAGPTGVLFSPDGQYLYVTGGYDVCSGALRYNASTGEFIDVYLAGSTGGAAPYDLAWGPDGALYVSNDWRSGVVRYDGTTGGPGDVDRLSVDVGPNQTLAIRVNSEDWSSVTLTDGQGTPIDLGEDLDWGPGHAYAPHYFADAQTLTLTVEAADGLTTGPYTIEATVNAQFDRGTGDTGLVQSLAPSTILVDPGPAAVSRAAAIGSLEQPVDRLYVDTEPNTDWPFFDVRGSWDWMGGTSFSVNGRGNPNTPLDQGIAGWLCTTVSHGDPGYDSVDEARFFGRAGDVVNIRAWGSSSGGGTLGGLKLNLYVPGLSGDLHSLPVSGAPSDREFKDFTLAATGTYRMQVYSFANTEGTYTLTLDMTTPANPRPNTIGIYSVAATEGESLRVEVATGEDPVLGDPKAQLALYAPDGTLVATSNPSGALDALIEYVASATGDYRIEVTAGPGMTTSSMDYTLVARSGASTEFGIRSPSDLPSGHVEQPYAYALRANRGVEPYQWQILAGELPDGLSLDPSTGIISGTPPTVGDWTFTAQVTDAASATDSREFYLTVSDELAIIGPAQLATAYLGQPYNETVLAAGGAEPYQWSLIGTGYYTETLGSGGYIGGGVAQGWRADEATWDLSLPWAFPYYGNEYTAVHISSNGFLDFFSPSADYENSQGELIANVRIAPLWDDLDTSDPGEDIFVTRTADYVVIRWAAHTWDFGTPVDAEVVLYRNGNIQFNYGEAHSWLTPTIGISKGDGIHYLISARDDTFSILPNVSSLFTYRPVLPEGITFDPATGQFSGTPLQAGDYPFTVEVRGSGVPAGLDTRHYTLRVVEPTTVLSLSLPGEATEGDGLLAGQGRITASQPVPEDLLVTLTSSAPGVVTLPQTTVLIPQGGTSAVFDLLIEDDALVDGPQRATITAAAPGSNNPSAEIFVHDNESAVIALSIPGRAREGDGVLAGQGMIELSGPADRDVTVSLTCDTPGKLDLPAAVTVPAGQTSALFDLGVLDDAAPDGARVVTVTAQVANWTGDMQSILVIDNDSGLALALPAALWEGQGTQPGAGLVSMVAPLPFDIVVTLTADDATELLVPPAVIIPAGRTSAPFDVDVLDDADRDGRQSVAVSAQTELVLPGEGAIIVRDDDLDHFSFEPIASPQTAAVSFPVLVTARDILDETIEVYGGQVTLAASGDEGTYPIETDPPGGLVPLANGVWSGRVTVSALGTNVAMSVDDGAGRTGQSGRFDVVSGPLDHFEFGPIPSPQAVGAGFPVTLTARDVRGFCVARCDYPFNLTGWVVSGTPSTLVVSECGEQLPDYVEIQNVSGRTLDTLGWIVAVNNAQMANINSVHDVVWRLPDQVAAGEVLYRTDSLTDNYFGGDIWWGIATKKGWAMILDQSGRLVDFAVWGYSVDEIAAMDVTVAGHRVRPGTQWSGAGVPYTNESTYVTHSLQRVGNTDNNVGTDFAWQPRSKGQPNAGMAGAFDVGTSPIAMTPIGTGPLSQGVWSGQVTVLEAAGRMYLRAVGPGDTVVYSNSFDVGQGGGLPGDFNADGVVNHFDMALWVAHSGTAPGDPNYDPQFDLNGDTLVSAPDAALLQSWMFGGRKSGGGVKASAAPAATLADAAFGELAAEETRAASVSATESAWTAWLAWGDGHFDQPWATRPRPSTAKAADLMFFCLDRKER